MTTDAAVLDWLLDSDPALRWRVQRDLQGEPPEVWRQTRARVATEGFGASVLARQDPDGQWDGGAYFPKDFDWKAQELDLAQAGGQPYIATTWALNSLRAWGVDAAALAGTAEKLEQNCRWEYEDLPYWGGETDCCINGFTLENGLWLGVDVSSIAQWFVEHRLPDGGWNCEWVEGSTRSSFHSTLNSLRSVLVYEAATGGAEELRTARKGAEEYLLERRLLRRLSTGEQMGPWATLLAYPPRAVYNVLTAADYFRAASLHDGTAPDPRLGEALEIIRSKRRPDGRWLQEWRHPGLAFVEEDAPVGQPSRWVTYYATRVLDWWERAAG